MAELALVALLVSLGLFTNKGAVHLQCFQVDPQTQTETSMGTITLHRKKQILATLENWGPNRMTRESNTVVALPDSRTPLSIAIYDTDQDMDGHAIILTRHNSMKKRYQLSDNVVDSSRLDYCIRINKKTWKKLQLSESQL